MIKSMLNLINIKTTLKDKQDFSGILIEIKPQTTINTSKNIIIYFINVIHL